MIRTHGLRTPLIPVRPHVTFRNPALIQPSAMCPAQAYTGHSIEALRLYALPPLSTEPLCCDRNNKFWFILLNLSKKEKSKVLSLRCPLTKHVNTYELQIPVS